MAIIIGLLVANILQPGKWGNMTLPDNITMPAQKLDPWGLLQNSVPASVVEPLVSNDVIQLIVIALSFGIVLRAVKTTQIEQGKHDYLAIEQGISVLLEVIIRLLHLVITLVPFAVFGIVAKVIALQGFAPFQSLFIFVIAVLVALFLQAAYYIIRVRLGSWVSPQRFLTGGSDALWTAFSTASSTVTMPITFESLQKKSGPARVF
jgi:Na+/H+-dicarboxylate symporter